MAPRASWVLLAPGVGCMLSISTLPLPGRTQDPRRLCWGIAGPKGPGWNQQRKQKGLAEGSLHLGSLCLDLNPSGWHQPFTMH